MSVRWRFSLFFSVLVTILISVFSVVVYLKVQEKLCETAANSLHQHFEHEFSHIANQDRPLLSQYFKGAPKDIYHKISRDGEEIESSLLPSEELSAGLEPTFLEGRVTLKINKEVSGHRYEIVGYYDLRSVIEYLRDLKSVLAFACLISLLVIAPVAYVSTGFLLAPFKELANSAFLVTPKRLSFRFKSPARKDEFGLLVHAFNNLFGRLELGFNHLASFASNASHEIRTPLAVIIGQAETSLRRTRTVEEYQTSISKILSKAQQLRKTVNHLLVVSDIDRSETTGESETFDVAKCVEEVVSSLQFAYAGSSKRILVEAPAKNVTFQGNAESFLGILGNLLENSLKYSRSKVKVSFKKKEGVLQLCVEDDGPGLPPEKRRQMVDRSFHGSIGMPSATGHGLGLSIVKTCIDSSRGEILMAKSSLGGLLVEVSLPEMG